MDEIQSQKLASSKDMVPVQGSVDIDIPADELWTLFARPNLWSRWNPCFLWALNTVLVPGEHLVWCFKPMKNYYPYVMPAIANIIELVPGRKVTWEVTALPGFYAHHTYSVEPLGPGRSRFSSWEQAMGGGFLRMKRFWLAHFTFVKDSSLAGARTLGEIYRRDGNLYALAEQRDHLASLKDGALTALSAVAPLWFYRSFLRPEVVPMAPGVHAVLGGGSNSLVVESEGEALVVDTKFPPGANQLARWAKRHVKSPVTKIVNTHYHYDHTQGNELYPQATIIAHERVPEMMLQQEGEFWAHHRQGVPGVGVGDGGQTIRVGKKTIELFYPGPAHTRGDLVVHLVEDDILATGDLFFHTYYPFFDLSRAGVAIPDIIAAIRALASRYPTARVMPGHGPLATIQELRAYASYLEYLIESVSRAVAAGQSEREVMRTVALEAWKRKILPSFHGSRLSWGTRENNIRSVYRAIVARRSRPAPVSNGVSPQLVAGGTQ